MPVLQARYSRLFKPLLPKPHGRCAGAQTALDLTIRQAVSKRQNHTGTKDIAWWQGARLSPAIEFFMFFGGEPQQPPILRHKAKAPGSIESWLPNAKKPKGTYRIVTECRAIWQTTMQDYLQHVRELPPQVVSRELSRGMALDSLERGVSVIRDRYGDILKMLTASVGLIVLLVCANVGGILLARSAARQHEMALRLALGATQWHLARQVLVETCLLALPASVGGFAVALNAMSFMIHLLPPIRDVSTSLIAVSVDVRLNWRAFFFLLSLTLLTVLLSSIMPALGISRTSLDIVLRAVPSARRWRARQVLVTFQIALCTLLLATASLFVRTFQQLRRTNPGFDRDHVATFTIDPGGRPGSSALMRTFSERVGELPGVISVAWSTIGLMRDHGVSTTVAPVGGRLTYADFLNTNLNNVSPRFFATMGMRILAGRDFQATDIPEPKVTGPEMVVVNQAFAQRFFPHTDPVGKRFGSARGMEGVADGRFEVIGVVSDAKYRSLREPIKPMFYTLDSGAGQLVLYVRTHVQPEGIIEPVRRVLAKVDPSLPFLEVHMLAEEVDSSVAAERLAAAIGSLFGAIAALLAGTGIYGLLACVVADRRREIGIRMALGAGTTRIGGVIARQILAMTVRHYLGTGICVRRTKGCFVRYFTVSLPEDPKSLLVATVFVAVLAAAASIVPAVRATRTDPILSLRCQ